MRAALEAELKRIRVDDVLLQTVVSLINVAGRKAGLAPGSESERDLGQVRLAIEGVRALLPLVEQSLGAQGAQDVRAIRDALSRLQVAYAKLTGEPSAPGGEAAAAGERGGPEPESGGAEPAEGGPEQEGSEARGPAQRSGRLWVPGE
jgi:hypothetical protein